MKLSGADIIIRTLIEHGCDVVFGYPGGNVLDVYDSLYKYREEICHVLSAHEQGAAHAADGYARVTGKCGVVIATSGPGATNLVTGIATAYLDSVPMVAICGNVETDRIGTDSFQEIDITGITLPITKHNYFVSDVEELADTICEAFMLARSGRPGPVLVDVPRDVQRALCEYQPKAPLEPQGMIAAKAIRISAAAEFINLSNRPIVYFGGGVVSSGAQAQVAELAELLDAPIACSMMGISAIPTDHPRFLGMQGMHGGYASSRAMDNADCIIALGVRFNDRAMGDGARFASSGKIVHIDIEGAELSKTVSEEHSLRGDLKLTLSELIPLIEKRERPHWSAEIERYKTEQEKHCDTRAGMTPRAVIEAINRHAGENTPIATDVGQHQMWAAQFLNFKRERRFVSSGGLGTMGFGMGAAIGAAIGAGERAILITGDGSFGMSLNELATAVSNNVPVTVVIFNNRALGMVRQIQSEIFDGRYSHTELDRKTDFVAVARAFGAEGCRAETVSELETALEHAEKSGGVYVIDCALSRDETVFSPYNGLGE